ncbi:MAG: hypothetical protein WBG32_22035 [Nodosilinea sp.]
MWGPQHILETPHQLEKQIQQVSPNDPNRDWIITRLALLLQIKTGAARSARTAAHNLNVPVVTAMKWLGAYREDGINALLIYDVGGNPGTPRQPKESPESIKSQASAKCRTRKTTSSRGASRQTLRVTSELAERINRFVSSQLGDSLKGKLRSSSGQIYQRLLGQLMARGMTVEYRDDTEDSDSSGRLRQRPKLDRSITISLDEVSGLEVRLKDIPTQERGRYLRHLLSAGLDLAERS